jgi:RIO-like serine/threonine protein kinase
MHESTILQPSRSKLLKKDVFGSTRVIGTGDTAVIRRDTRDGRPLVRWIARRLLAAEVEALAVLDGLSGTPELVRHDRYSLDRSYLPGAPMQDARPQDPAYFRRASRLLRRLHRRGVVHNDLAKEPNLLVTEDGLPAIIDFQLAWTSQRRGRLFRLLAREDIRHLLKHKRTYCPASLTARERNILETPSMLSRAWMQTVKPVYLFITRRLMGWQDREGAGDRV